MALSESSQLFLVLIAVLASAIFYLKFPKRYPLPPGPRKLPILGNLFDSPSSYEWEQYSKWAKEYNTDILHLDVCGQSIVILDTHEACTALLERKSKYYSSRPGLTMAIDLVGLDFNVGIIPYGDRWRARRRLIHEMLHAKAVRRFDPIILRSTHALLEALLGAGQDDLEQELRHWAARIILGTTYGFDIQTKDDPHVSNAEAVQDYFSATANQASYLVNSIPILKYVPEWMPGAAFKRQVREWKDHVRYMVNTPFDEVKNNLCETPCAPSIASLALEKGIEQDIIKDSCATMHMAGTDTTVCAILNFTLAMLDHPELLECAQRELDKIVPGRLPDFADEERLPFVTAIVLESLRYMPVTPLAISHYFSGDEPDLYKGYMIPPGSVVIANVWSMAHDEDVYPDPYAFKPDRFLTDDGTINRDVRDPCVFAFGFGRRICPGRRLAYASIWIAIASILKTSDIRKAKRADGSVIESSEGWASGLVSLPKPFKCQLTARNAEAHAIIRAAANNQY
ncbi:cytochrome P450 [Schizophyllum commune H4-8]|uniref:cytochrome P450 n=1 Tax=Schizophyllum commune (strain H4-8 / FGSC 9210) TaxID=578458 RepID=UPI00215FC074|nr:cytochrome P450 [Schizophyllum commune H4-8]KAI5889620.1 cytochrome P450 [Schizophyllum commune H4-8]